MITKIDNFGRILIPKKIRKKLGLEPGERIGIETSGKKIILKVNQENKANQKNLKSFKKLLAFNQQFQLTVDPNIDLSELNSKINK